MTDVALKEHLEKTIRDVERILDEKIVALRREIDIQKAADARALTLAAEGVASAFAKVNELREQVTQERGMFPRQEKLDALQREVALLATTLSDRIGRVERLYPIVALGSAFLGAAGASLAIKLFGG